MLAIPSLDYNLVTIYFGGSLQRSIKFPFSLSILFIMQTKNDDDIACIFFFGYLI
jgi:hypothetical protein